MTDEQRPRERVQVDFTGDPGRTKQSFRDDTDMNVIAARYIAGSAMPIVTGRPHYGDFTNAGDYLSAVNRVQDAANAFQALPALIRARFENEPGQLLEFLEDPENQEEAEELGLVTRAEPITAPPETQTEPPPPEEPETPETPPQG